VLKKVIALFLSLCFLSTVAPFAQAVDTTTISPAAIQAAQQYLQNNQQGKSSISGNQQQQSNQDQVDTDEKINFLTMDPTLEAKAKWDRLSKLEQDISKNITIEGYEPVTQFGYDLFKKSASSFLPTSQEDVPVNSDYIIGPGDTFNITIWGVSEGIFKVSVNQNGEIVLPKVGVVNVAGLSYGQLKPFVESQLNKFYEGINVGITFGTLKTLRIYVVGEVKQPGSYSLNSLSTAYAALFAAGGPTKQGSMRDIKILRNGRAVATIDLYKFLLKGDSSQDRQLQSGDTVFVPVIGDVAAVVGAVKRPAIYEIKGQADLVDVLWLAGGVNAATYLNRVQIERMVAHQKKIVMDEQVAALSEKVQMGIPIRDLDIIKVFSVYASIENKVLLRGEVKYPGSYEYKEGMRLLDVLSKNSFKTAGIPQIEVVRAAAPGSSKTNIYPIDYQKLFVEKDSAYNIYLEPLDEISVFLPERKDESVTLKGEFKRPGKYALMLGERISSVIERAGGFTDYAYIYGAILTRPSIKSIQQENYMDLISKLEIDLLRKERELGNGMVAQQSISMKEETYSKTKQIIDYLKKKTFKGRVIVNLDDLSKLKGSKNDVELEDGDEVLVPKVPKSVVVLGEVYNPTAVSYIAGLRVRDYLSSVGGTTSTADNGGIYILRANGSVVSQRQGKDVVAMGLYPGDSILVPEKLDSVTLWGFTKDFTQWIFEAIASILVIDKVFK